MSLSLHWSMCDFVQLPGVKAKVFSEEYDLKEVGTFHSLTNYDNKICIMQ